MKKASMTVAKSEQALPEIPSGVTVFIDSNIFIYHFTGASDQCSEFLTRCEESDLEGITSVNVVLEVLHRLMMVEVVKKNILEPPNLVKKLQEKPEVVKQLHDYISNTQKISEMGIDIKPLTPSIIIDSHNIRRNDGLLVNDSIIVATALTYNLKHLASNDMGISSLGNVTVYRPTDIDV